MEKRLEGTAGQPALQQRGTEAAERTGLKGWREASARLPVGTRKSTSLGQSEPGNWPEVRWGTRPD